MVFTPQNEYTIVVSSMPKKSKIHFASGDLSDWVLLNIYFSQPLRIRPYLNGVYDASLERVAPIVCNPHVECGEVHGAHVQNPQKKFFSIMMRGNDNWDIVRKGFFSRHWPSCR